MISIIPFLKPDAAFDADITKVMDDAFDAACRELHDTGQPHVVKEIMAKRIIDAVRNGERNPQRLCAKALNALGLGSRF